MHWLCAALWKLPSEATGSHFVSVEEWWSLYGDSESDKRWYVTYVCTELTHHSHGHSWILPRSPCGNLKDWCRRRYGMLCNRAQTVQFPVLIKVWKAEEANGFHTILAFVSAQRNRQKSDPLMWKPDREVYVKCCYHILRRNLTKHIFKLIDLYFFFKKRKTLMR